MSKQSTTRVYNYQKEIKSLKKELRIKDEKIVLLNKEISLKKERIILLNNTISNKDEQIISNSRELTQLRNKIKILNDKIDVFSANIASLKVENNKQITLTMNAKKKQLEIEKNNINLFTKINELIQTMNNLQTLNMSLTTKIEEIKLIKMEQFIDNKNQNQNQNNDDNNDRDSVNDEFNSDDNNDDIDDDNNNNKQNTHKHNKMGKKRKSILKLSQSQTPSTLTRKRSKSGSSKLIKQPSINANSGYGDWSDLNDNNNDQNDNKTHKPNKKKTQKTRMRSSSKVKKKIKDRKSTDDQDDDADDMLREFGAASTDNNTNDNDNDNNDKNNDNNNHPTKSKGSKKKKNKKDRDNGICFDTYLDDLNESKLKITKNGKLISMEYFTDSLYVISSIGFPANSGKHEWEIRCIKCGDLADEIGVCSKWGNLQVNGNGIADMGSDQLGARAVYANDPSTGVAFHDAYDNTNKLTYDKKFKKKGKKSEFVWNKGDVIKVSLNCNKWSISFYLNGKKVGKSIALDKDLTYYPILCAYGSNSYQVL